MADEFLNDVKTIRERARRHIEWILAMEEKHADDLVNRLTTLDPTKKG